MSAATPFRRAEDVELADLVSGGAAELALSLSASNVDQLVAYLRLIERWNATYNLTAIRDPRDMAVQHLLDCLAAAAALGRRRGAGAGERVIDVGSGAGLPGLILAIAFPGRKVTCVDSVGKKAAFITQVAGTLGLGNVKAVHSRIEDVAPGFDVITSRAFASLSDFVSATAHLSEDPTWMAMKGKVPDDELASLAPPLAFDVEPLHVPGLAAERCLVWIEKRRSKASARL